MLGAGAKRRDEDERMLLKEVERLKGKNDDCIPVARAKGIPWRVTLDTIQETS
jgi:hypothetical protein